jgi:glycosyltransferase involved in cell wall biosynthesis
VELTLIAVCRNEAGSGHLDSFLKWNVSTFDNVLVYDDASDDGTPELLKAVGVEVIENEFSIFRNELIIREILLKEARGRFPKTDWFMILDLDEVLTCNREELESLIVKAEQKKCTGVSFRLVNLWKSERFFRTDEHFNSVAKIHLWKNTEAMSFSGESGLHRELHPRSIKTIYIQDSVRILHLGFSTRKKIVQKFLNYKKLGQEGRSLWRLIDERFMKTQEITSISSLLGENFNSWLEDANSDQPITTSVAHYLWDVRALECSQKKEAQKPIVTLVCLIYSGIDWLEFAYGELLLLQKEFDEGQVEILFCANDASAEVLVFLRSNNIPFIEFNNSDPNEHYISRVYRAYNFATSRAKADYCLLVNSDMAYTPGFLTKMLMQKNVKSFVVARLVESGTLKPGPLAMKKNFGKSLRRFRRQAFYKYALQREKVGYKEGGLYMPLLISRTEFLNLGGFPEGNLTPESLREYLGDEEFEVAQPGLPCVSGDYALFEKAKLRGFKHITSLSAIAYHFQEGEKRHASKESNNKVRSGFAVANDSLRGINQERVLWDILCDLLEKHSIQVHKWNTGKVSFPLIFLRRLPFLNFTPKTKPRVCLQNASYLPIIDKNARGIALLQDNLFDSRLVRMQTEVLRNAKSVVTNSIPMINLDAKNHLIWQPLPISDLFILSAPTAERIPNTCVFVGAFDNTKGWPEVREIIKNNPTIHFNVVSKYESDSPGDLGDFAGNVQIHRRLSQDSLLRLYDSSTFFLIGSPLETQCLAAMEAASRDVTIVMKKTGLLAESPYSNLFGYFDNNLAKAFAEAKESKRSDLRPRETLLKMNLSTSALEEEWENILLQEIRHSFHPSVSATRTIRERIIRKFKSPRLVRDHA